MLHEAALQINKDPSYQPKSKTVEVKGGYSGFSGHVCLVFSNALLTEQ